MNQVEISADELGFLEVITHLDVRKTTLPDGNEGVSKCQSRCALYLRGFKENQVLGTSKFKEFNHNYP